jgi:hypothetical protein
VFEFGGAVLDDLIFDDGSTWMRFGEPSGGESVGPLGVTSFTIPRLIHGAKEVDSVLNIIQPGDELVWVQLLDGGRVSPDPKYIDWGQASPSIPGAQFDQPPRQFLPLTIVAEINGYEEVPPYVDVTTAFSINTEGQLLQTDYFSIDANTNLHWNIYPTSGPLVWRFGFTFTPPSPRTTVSWKDPTAKKTRFQSMIRRASS